MTKHLVDEFRGVVSSRTGSHRCIGTAGFSTLTLKHNEPLPTPQLIFDSLTLQLQKNRQKDDLEMSEK